jgi:GNAT superfamily N-acetyltransferase
VPAAEPPWSTPPWSTSPWAPLRDGEFDDLARLAARCLAADGGLPLSADAGFLRRRHAGRGIVTRTVRDTGGRLVAAGSAGPTAGGGLVAGSAGPTAGGGPVVAGSAGPTGGGDDSGESTTFTGLVDPDVRGRGLGSWLLESGLAEGARLGGPVTVETEALTPATEALFTGRGLRQVFAEDVMCRDLTADPPAAVWPDGTALSSWSAATELRFHAVYEAAFRERPGFPGWSAAQWIDGVATDDEFRPEWSVLASLPGAGDVGFVTAAVDWIVQVGVVPAARGMGLGAALVGEALRRMRAEGATEAWLDVNVDNPASRLYRRLGFVDRGRRARYRR